MRSCRMLSSADYRPAQKRCFPGPMHGMAAIPTCASRGKATPGASKRTRRRRPGPAGDAARAKAFRTATDARLLSQLSLESQPGTADLHRGFIEARGPPEWLPIYCTCADGPCKQAAGLWQTCRRQGHIFASTLLPPVGVSTGKRRSLPKIRSDLIAKQAALYQQSVATAGNAERQLSMRSKQRWAGTPSTSRETPRDLAGQPRLERRLGRLRALRLGYFFRGYHGRASATATWLMPTRWRFCARRPHRALCPTMRAPAIGRAPTAPSRRWARLPCLGFTRSFTTAGFSKTPLSRC